MGRRREGMCNTAFSGCPPMLLQSLTILVSLTSYYTPSSETIFVISYSDHRSLKPRLRIQTSFHTPHNHSSHPLKSLIKPSPSTLTHSCSQVTHSDPVTHHTPLVTLPHTHHTPSPHKHPHSRITLYICPSLDKHSHCLYHMAFCCRSQSSHPLTV